MRFTKSKKIIFLTMVLSLLNIHFSYPLLASSSLQSAKRQVFFTNAVDDFVSSYDAAQRHYSRMGPEALIHILAPGASSSDREFLAKVLGKLPKMPSISRDASLLILDGSHLGLGVHTIEVSKMDDGILVVDGRPVAFDSKKASVEYFSLLVFESLDKTTVSKLSKTNFWNQWILSDAMAADMGKAALWTLVGMLGGLATNWVWSKWQNRTSQSAETYEGSRAVPQH